ncbi:PH domain-containing protein [Croceicoccus sp. Ery5]|uniref:PH domain-containing protein n=1 Tax=Croceicoccus sp. Ery5 TaxID=1703340 RepID=UPI001E3AFBD8|nr:PH domain-containing protein [Croceicoccus sp. Ery5]
MSDHAETRPPTAGQRTEILGLVPAIGKSLAQAVFAMVAVTIGSSELRSYPLALIGIAMLVIGGALGSAFLRWWRTEYRVGADDIRLETGLLSREARSVPYERIQDVSIAEPLLARLLGLVSVTFETGAGGKDEISLAYVTRAEGERLRAVVRRQHEAPRAAVDAPADTKLSAPPETPAQTLFAMDLKRVLHFGVFEFSLVVLAAIGAALQQFDFLLPFDIWSARFWTGLFEVQADTIRHWGFIAQALGAVLAVASLLVLGVATGVVRTVLRDYDFRLEKTDRGFRRRRGLLNRTDVVMPVHRVQAGVLATGLVRRWFGWHSLAFVSLANDAKSASHDVAPFAQPDEIAPVARAARIALPGPETQWHRPSARPWVDCFALFAVVLIAAGAGMMIGGVDWWYTPWLVVPVLAGLFTLNWMRRGWAMEDGQVFVRTGLLAPVITSAPAIKLQSVEIARGPLGMLRGYVALKCGLAGGSLELDGLMAETAESLRQAILAEIARVDFSRLNTPQPAVNS